MTLLILERKSKSLLYADIRIVAARKADPERHIMRCSLLGEVFEVLDHFHDLLLIALIKSIHKAGERFFTKTQDSVTKDILENIQRRAATLVVRYDIRVIQY